MMDAVIVLAFILLRRPCRLVGLTDFQMLLVQAVALSIPD